MMYYLYYLSQGPHPLNTAFNVFQYVSFRAVFAAITAFLFCLVFGSRVIRMLVSLKLGQPIRTADEVHRLYELHRRFSRTRLAGLPLFGTTLGNP